MTDAANGANMRKLIRRRPTRHARRRNRDGARRSQAPTLQDGTTAVTPQQPLDRQHYFKELLRLQGELVKLQDWVQHQKLKVVVIFEGRDSAGKGGVIKRITQRLNPRICRVARFPRPANASARNGISSATSRICRPAARSCCSTAPGTTAPASSA